MFLNYKFAMKQPDVIDPNNLIRDEKLTREVPRRPGVISPSHVMDKIFT